MPTIMLKAKTRPAVIALTDSIAFLALVPINGPPAIEG
jgi:hypothetical protein